MADEPRAEREALGWDEMREAVSAICTPLPESRKLRDRILDALTAAEQREAELRKTLDSDEVRALVRQFDRWRGDDQALDALMRVVTDARRALQAPGEDANG